MWWICCLLVFFFLWFFFFFNDTATTEIYTLSLHDALPRLGHGHRYSPGAHRGTLRRIPTGRRHHCPRLDRKSTRLNSSHLVISYAVFCLKKKKTHTVGYLDYNKKKHNYH